MGLGNDDERPTKTRIVLDCQEFSLTGPTYILYETKPGALATAYANTTRNRLLAEGTPVMCIPLRGRPVLYIESNKVPPAEKFRMNGRDLDVRKITLTHIGV